MAAGSSPSSGESTTTGPPTDGFTTVHGPAQVGPTLTENAPPPTALTFTALDLGRDAGDVRGERAGRLLDEGVGAVLVGQAHGHQPVRVDHPGRRPAVVVVEDRGGVPAGERVPEGAELAEPAAVAPAVALEGDGRAEDGRRRPRGVGGGLAWPGCRPRRARRRRPGRTPSPSPPRRLPRRRACRPRPGRAGRGRREQRPGGPQGDPRHLPRRAITAAPDASPPGSATGSGHAGGRRSGASAPRMLPEWKMITTPRRPFSAPRVATARNRPGRPGSRSRAGRRRRSAAPARRAGAGAAGPSRRRPRRRRRTGRPTGSTARAS